MECCIFLMTIFIILSVKEKFFCYLPCLMTGTTEKAIKNPSVPFTGCILPNRLYPPPGITPVVIPGPLHEHYPYPVADHTLAIPVQASILNQEKLLVMMKQLQDSVRNHYDPVTLDYMTTAVLCELHSQLYREFNAKSSARSSTKQIYFDIIEYIRLNSTKNLKVSDVAGHFGYNQKYLSHLFSKISGLSLKQFIMNVRMDTANYMLSDTNASIAEIAASLGFSDSHNFSKAYKKIAGMTPSEYRNAFSKRVLNDI